MTNSQLLLTLTALLAALVVAGGLMLWLRGWLKPRPDQPQVRVLGAYSPLLTWLRYGRLPQRALPLAASAPPEVPALPRSTALQTLFLLALGLVLLVIGQHQIAAPGGIRALPSRWLNAHLFLEIANLDQVLGGLPLLLAGAVLIVKAVSVAPLLSRDVNRACLPAGALNLRLLGSSWRWGALALALLVLLLGLLAAGRYGPAAVALWFVSLGLLAALAWHWDRRGGVGHSPHLRRPDWLWLIALTLFGLLVGMFRLVAVPNGLMGDEGSFFTTARDIASGEYRPALFDFGVYTYPILSSIYQAAFLRLFGASLWAWRFASVAAGVAAVWPLYLLARDWFSRQVAVVACLVLLTLPYFLAFARLGYNNIQVLPILTLTGYSLYHGLRRGSALFLLLAGCAAGLGFYTYTAGRGALLLAGLWVALGWLGRPAERRQWLTAGAMLALGWGAVTLPHLVHGAVTSAGAHGHKLLESIFFTADFGRRFFDDRQLFALAPPIVIGESTLFYHPGLYALLLVRGLFRTLLAFQAPMLVTEHFIASPLAGPGSAGFHLVGLGLALAHLRQARFRYLGLWVVVTLLVLSAANTFPPRHQHLVGVQPAVAVLVAVAVAAVIQTLGLLTRSLRQAWATRLALVLVTAAMAAVGLYNYFGVVPAVYRPNLEQVISSASHYARGRPIIFVYSAADANTSLAHRGPFTIAELNRHQAYTAVPVEEVISGRFTFPGEMPVLVFYAPADDEAVRGAAEASWPAAWRQQFFFDREGRPIGGVVSNGPLDFYPATSPAGILAESYAGPGLPVLIAMALLLVVAAAVPRRWVALGPARVVLDWLSQPLPPTPGASSRELPATVPASMPAVAQTVSTRIAAPQPVQPPLSPIEQSDAPRTASARQWLVPFVAWLAIGLALAGQSLLFYGRDIPAATIWLALAAALMALLAPALSTLFQPPLTTSVPAPGEAWLTNERHRRYLLLSSGGLALLVFFQLGTRGPGDPHWDVLVLWLLSMAAYLAPWWPRPAARRASARLRRLRLSLPWLWLGALLITGAALRLLALNTIPLVMDNDEGTVGRQTLAVMAGDLGSMFQTFGGYGTLQFFLMALPVSLFGPTKFALRCLSALGGVLTLLVVARLAGHLFGRRVALLATALLALSHFHIHFTRVSATASSFDPLFAALALFLVYRAVRASRRFDWAMAGVVMALPLYFYVGARLVPLMAGVFVALYAAQQGRRWRQPLAGALIGLGGYLVAAMPMLWWALDSPAAFNARLNQVGIFPTGWLAHEVLNRGVPAWRVLVEQLGQALLLFGYHPARWFYDAGVPMVDVVTGGLFMAGLAFALVKWRDPRFLLLNVWFWAAIFTGQVLMVDPAANAYRTMTVMPVVVILAAVALVGLLGLAVGDTGWRRRLVSGVLVLSALGVGAWNVRYYFWQWAPSFVYTDPRTRLASLVAEYAGALGPDYHIYVASTSDFSIRGWAAVAYLGQGVLVEDVPGDPLDAVRAALSARQPVAVVFPAERAAEASNLQILVPGGQRVERRLGDALYFVAYELPASPASTPRAGPD